jgi:tRNA threonylcarbamoyladenosine biosynthesis protein TsaE
MGKEDSWSARETIKNIIANKWFSIESPCLTTRVPLPVCESAASRIHFARAIRIYVSHLLDQRQPAGNAHWAGHLQNEAATAELGARLASSLSRGMRVYLRGELGSGKTTLIRGLLRALGVQTGVRSPSYTLVELYVISRLNLYHFDFYRFLDPDEFEAAGFADYFDGDAVCLVEWPDKAGRALPLPDLEIALAYAGSGRDIRVHANSPAGEQCLDRLRET